LPEGRSGLIDRRCFARGADFSKLASVARHGGRHGLTATRSLRGAQVWFHRSPSGKNWRQKQKAPSRRRGRSPAELAVDEADLPFLRRLHRAMAQHEMREGKSTAHFVRRQWTLV